MLGFNSAPRGSNERRSRKVVLLWNVLFCRRDNAARQAEQQAGRQAGREGGRGKKGGTEGRGTRERKQDTQEAAA